MAGADAGVYVDIGRGARDTGQGDRTSAGCSCIWAGLSGSTGTGTTESHICLVSRWQPCRLRLGGFALKQTEIHHNGIHLAIYLYTYSCSRIRPDPDRHVHWHQHPGTGACEGHRRAAQIPAPSQRIRAVWGRAFAEPPVSRRRVAEAWPPVPPSAQANSRFTIVRLPHTGAACTTAAGDSMQTTKLDEITSALLTDSIQVHMPNDHFGQPCHSIYCCCKFLIKRDLSIS